MSTKRTCAISFLTSLAIAADTIPVSLAKIEFNDQPPVSGSEPSPENG